MRHNGLSLFTCMKGMLVLNSACFPYLTSSLKSIFEKFRSVEYFGLCIIRQCLLHKEKDESTCKKRGEKTRILCGLL